MKNKLNKYIFFLVVTFFSLTSQAQETTLKLDSTIVEQDELINLKKAKKYILGGISIKGNTKFSEQSIKAFSGLSEGKEIKIPGDKLSSAIKKLWESKLFNNVDVYAVKIDSNAIYLEFEVEELSKINKVEIIGLSKGKIKSLVSEIELKKDAMLTENLVTTTKNFIKKKYTDKGYLNTKVNIDYKKDSTQAYNAIIVVDRGEKIKIKNLRFHGNTALKDKKLAKQLKKTKQKSIFNIFTASKYREEEYSADLERLINKYREKGYRDAQVISDSISWNDDNTINLDITVNEGKKYVFGDVDFIGNTVYSDEKLTEFLGLFKGDTYNGKLLNERVNGDGGPDSQDIATTYLNNGYMFSNVNSVETSVINDTINIEIRIHEDEPAYIRKIKVIGNDKTNDHVVYRELRTRPGDLFSKEAIIRSVREISQLGFFDPEAVVPDVKPNYQDKTVDIDYNVAERGSSQIELQGGFGGGMFIGTLGLSFSNFSVRNLFNKKAYRPVPMGDGQNVALRLQASRFSSTYSLSFTEPWFGGKKPRSLSFSIYNSKQFRFNPATRDVDRNQKLDILGATVGVGQQLRWPDDYFSLSTSLNFQRYTLKNYNLPGFNFENGTGVSNNLAFSVSLRRNSTGPSRIYPMSGSEFSISAKLTPPFSLLQNRDFDNETNEDKFKWLEFYKLSYSGRWYNAIYNKLVLRSAFNFGFLGAYNNELGVSPFERFFVGGDGLGGINFDGREIIGLRGYPNSGLTPSINGGTVYNKFSMELRYPITLKPSASIYVLGFLEGGNSFDDINTFDPFNIKRAAGMGIRIFMPAFGILGIDFAHGFDNMPGASVKSGWQTHFIINQQF
ncbi:MAG: outer membrane protein assembly factor BamA [Flavobacteriaceae bacterium]|nr:outer membrane protein assembly factor BamA [Flavobacteriaceae bacterium]